MLIMKRLIPLLFVLALCLSCKEDFIGQYPVDSIPPSKVLNAVVENYPGRVVITYDLPNDTDLLYVKAVYTDAHGQKNEVRASNFKNKLEIKGFAKSQPQSVQLISVDRSQNESDPLRVDIEPLEETIDGLCFEMNRKCNAFSCNCRNCTVSWKPKTNCFCKTVH